MGRHLSQRYSQVILVSGYPVLSVFLCSQTSKSMRMNVARDDRAQNRGLAMDNDVIWPVLRNRACANPRKLKID